MAVRRQAVSNLPSALSDTRHGDNTNDGDYAALRRGGRTTALRPFCLSDFCLLISPSSICRNLRKDLESSKMTRGLPM